MNIENNSWLFDVSEERLFTDFGESNARVIVDVANNSPASLLGLEVNDYLVTVDNLNASTIDVMELLVDCKENMRYQFYSRSKHSYINVVASTIPLGIVTEPSSKGILERCSSEGFYDWSDFEILWKRRNWDVLLEVSELVSSNSIFSRFIRIFSKRFGISAEILFGGAAMYERGETDKAMEQIGLFIDEDLNNHETSIQAIAYYYAAKWAELNEDSKGSQYWLAESNRSNGGHFERIAQEVHLKGYESPSVRYSWSDKIFPELYNLQRLGESETVSLQETLTSMSPDELLPVCVMPAYRGNGPYNDAMRCYRAIYNYVSNRIRPIQVILDVTEKQADQSWWYENEEQAINSGIAINLLYDSERTVADRLELEFSPVFYLLTNRGEVRYEGPLREATDYWNALAGSQP
jgi:hypothetical protein